MPLPNDFMTELYDRVHETPMQRKFRRLHPMPAGVVFIQWPGMGEQEIRQHFRTIRELGFSCLKGIGLVPGTDMKQVMHWALDEGLIPWWYDDGGWEEITDELLVKLGIDPKLPIAQIREHPRMREHQVKVLRERVDRHAKPVRRKRKQGDDDGDAPLTGRHVLDQRLLPAFLEWLREKYGTIEKLREAWNIGRMIYSGPGTWDSWENLGSALGTILEHNNADRGREWRRICDVLRFKAHAYLERLRHGFSEARQHDPHEPYRAGGEMGLFLAFAASGVDMEGIADVMSEFGSFYPSIHLGWHFEEVDFEVVRPAYMMSSLCTDWSKGIWSAAWESTGGPQQLSHGKAPFWPPAQDKTAGFTVSGGVMTQLMLSYLAGGFRGFGFWCWTARYAGFEVGEYALTDRLGRPCERTIQAGRVARAARRLRDELWEARKEPLAGVYVDFDHSAMWAAAAVGGRDVFKHIPMQSRVGASRAFINHNIPWEHVTGCDLRNGLAGRYRTIYLPTVFMLHSEILAALLAYVKQGGRVVMDLPGGAVDEFGRLLQTGRGSAFEQLFGCTLCDLQYSSNVPRSLDGQRLTGFVADLEPTTARVVARYDNGQPAITEARVGEGTSVILGHEAALACFKPGNAWAEQHLVTHALGDLQSPYACDGGPVYRLAAPAADHYFFLNDGPATTVRLDTKNYRYRAVQDAVTEEALTLGAPIQLPAYSGRWLRFEK